MEKKITIKQIPVAQPRPKITRFGNFDPAKDKKNWARIQISQQLDITIGDPIELHLVFYMPIPKNTSKKKKELMINNEIKHQKNKDIDNLIKFIMDAMNGVAFKDDRQIWNITASKLYSTEPRTEVTLKW